MFAIQLSFYLDAEIVQCTNEIIHDIFPDLTWGLEADLLKHSSEWPDAVALIKDREHYEAKERCDFPVEINFVHFPGRISGNDEEMRTLKLALLRKLSAIFECAVLCNASEYCREENDIPSYSSQETFLCRSGRIFCGNLSYYDVRDGAKPRRGWLPLDDLPSLTIGTKGRILSTQPSIPNWIEKRDQSHLDDDELPIYPETVKEEPPVKLTQTEWEAEVAAEFPTQAEIEAEEAEAAEHFKRLDAWERGYQTTASKQLIGSGISPPPPESLQDDDALSEKLWEVIHGLHKCNTFLASTDHLSDRELYTYLWNEGLNEGIIDLSGLSGCGMHFDILGAGDEKSKKLSLTYYDSAEDRAQWLASFPDETIPAYITKPYNRDRKLPKRDY